MTTLSQSMREIEELRKRVNDRRARYICILGTCLGVSFGYVFALMTFRIGGYF